MLKNQAVDQLDHVTTCIKKAGNICEIERPLRLCYNYFRYRGNKSLRFGSLVPNLKHFDVRVVLQVNYSVGDSPGLLRSVGT